MLSLFNWIYFSEILVVIDLDGDWSGLESDNIDIEHKYKLLTIKQRQTINYIFGRHLNIFFLNVVLTFTLECKM